MEANDDTARKAAWTSYWATGGLHSCIGSFAGNYSGAIGRFWADVFATLAPGQRVLDLATGNGALPLMLVEHRAQDGLRIDAVDLAELSPAWYRPEVHAGIHFHPGVAMEALPFEAGRFDLVVSQFGFEYADRGKALQECLRVLDGKGQLALVMHHAGSVLVEVGRAELENQGFLLGESGLFPAARAVIPWFAQARSGVNLRGNGEAAACRENYNIAMLALARKAAGSRAPDVLNETRDAVHALLAQTGTDASTSLQALEGHREQLQQAQLRTAELIGHALGEAEASAMVARLEQARPEAQVRCEPISQAEGLLGWALRMLPAQSAG